VLKISAAATVALLLVLSSPSPGLAAVDDVPVAESGPVQADFEVQLFDLAAVRRLFQALVRLRPSMTEGERIAAWSDVSLMIEAVAGSSAAGLPHFDEVVGAAEAGRGLRVPATRGVATRDGVAYLMLTVGYSAREIADVLSGRIGLSALDTAQRMLVAGLGRDVAADYLDRQYALVIELRDAERARITAPQRGPGPTGPFDALIDYYAGLHQVEAALVRAVVQVESAYNPAARSHAGAIGLMQLMPGTAQELGVNPFVPEQNIEGGVRYLSQLIRKFGAIDLALVAYNAGPGFAERYLRGQVALYGETRDYVTNVLARLGAMR